jgi:hypothetical protein
MTDHYQPMSIRKRTVGKTIVTILILPSTRLAMYLELTTALIISEDRLTRVVRVVSEKKDTAEGYCHHY